MKTQFWKTDWFLGVVIAVAMVVFNSASNLIPASSAGPTTSACG